MLFKCDCYDIVSCGTGIRSDKYGYRLLNTKKLLETNEPYVLASQVKQVFHVDDLNNKGCVVVIRITSKRVMMTCLTLAPKKAMNCTAQWS